MPYAYLAAAEVCLGRDRNAREAVRSLRWLDPGFTISRFFVTVGVNADVFADFADAWRTAGLPD